MNEDQFADADGPAPTTALQSPSDALGALSLTTPAQPPVPRQPGAYIDDEAAAPPLPPPGQDLEDYGDEEDDDFDDEEWERELQGGLNEVMDQDWDVVSGDFTKRYNRMKQHVVATHSAFQPTASRTVATSSNPTVPLPAQNRPRPAQSTSSTPTATSEGSAIRTSKVSDQLASYSQYVSRLSIAPLFPTSAPASKKGGSEKILVKDKADRATVEQVLDPRTRLILFKMLGRGLLSRVDGCVSTGKEANVYHAITPDNDRLALKIYKTSILVFKDRDRYVSGEFRFKNGYARSNPRKMVRLWAEKELRNLRRMKSAGMRVPEAIEVRENVLVMQFMGDGEWEASPRLKDAPLPTETHRPLYLELLVIMRTIFTRCRLVHADLSEYNILYHDSHLWVIDVSQSVEHDHPHAFDFLRSDIQNGDAFFKRLGVSTLGLSRTFMYVTRKGTEGETDEEMLQEAERLLEETERGEAEDSDDEEEEEDNAGTTTSNTATNGGNNSTTSTSAPTPSAPSSTKKKFSESDEAVFAQSYIPRALDDVYDPERDVARVLRGEGDNLIYADITGVAKIQKENAGGVRFEEEGAAGTGVAGEKKASGEDDDEEDDDEEGSDSGSESDSDDEDGEDGEKVKRPRGKKHEDKDEKKKRRAELKEANREKRSQKMSKSAKARKVKKTSGKR